MGHILVTGSSGGANPEEITARASDVIEGKTTIDNDGNVVNGSIPNRRSVEEIISVSGKDDSGFYAPIPKGAYLQATWTGYPEVKVPHIKVKETYQIKPEIILAGNNIAGINGSIPISRTNKNHVKTMNDGFVWGDDRGLMYVIRIDEGHYIPPVSQNGYAYVGVSEPNLKPENIRLGVTIGGCTGTMPDILAGGVVFRDATFYGVLKGGLASTRPRKFNIAYYDPTNNGVAVERSLGTRYIANRISPAISAGTLEVNDSIRSWEVWDVMQEQSCIYIFKNSLNIRYINEIHIDAQMLTITGAYSRPIIEVGIMSTNMRKSARYEKARGGYYETTAYHILDCHYRINYSGDIGINVRNINEHAFLYVKMSYSIDRGNPPDTSNIYMKVNRISIS